jgi:predicted ATPase
MTYELSIALDKRGRSYVEAERLGQALKGLSAGSGLVWLWDSGDKNAQKTSVNLTSSRHLGIATLGGLKEHPRISQLKNFIANWYLSYFTPEAARHLPLAGSQKHLNRRGDNIGNVIQFMAREHPNRFQILLDKIAQRIPGIEKIEATKSPDGRLLLQFNDKGFQDLCSTNV